MKKWIKVALAATVMLVVVLINVFPRFSIAGVMIPDDAIDIATEPMSMNVPGFSSYDLKRLSNDMKLVTYDNNQLFCTNLAQPCESYQFASSQMTLYSAEGDVVWTLGGADDEDGIVFENHFVYVKAAAMLSDGTTVAFGQAVDLTTEALRNTLLYVDGDGVPFRLDIIDIQEYGFTHSSGHPDQDVVSFDEGGFAIMYFDALYGSVVIAFDAALDSAWHVTFDPSLDDFITDTYNRSHMEPLQFANGTIYIQSNASVHAYDSEGAWLWTRDLTESVTGFRIAKNGDVVVVSEEIETIERPENPFQWESPESDYVVVTTRILDGSNGEQRWIARYRYLSMHFNAMHFKGYYAWEDADGSVYTLLAEFVYDAVSYRMLALKHDADGRFVGSSMLNGTFLSEADMTTMWESRYKFDVDASADTVELMMPHLGANGTIPLAELAFEDAMPIVFDPALYHAFVMFRRFLNWTCLTAAAVVASIGGLRYCRKRASRKNPEDDPWTKTEE